MTKFFDYKTYIAKLFAVLRAYIRRDMRQISPLSICYYIHYIGWPWAMGMSSIVFFLQFVKHDTLYGLVISICWASANEESDIWDV